MDMVFLESLRTLCQGSRCIDRRWKQAARCLLYAAVLAVSVFLSACSFMRPEEPPIPESTLIELTVELHLADARGSNLGESTRALRDSIFAWYGVDEDTYNEAVAYYAERPDEYLLFYDAVLDSLNNHRP